MANLTKETLEGKKEKPQQLQEQGKFTTDKAAAAAVAQRCLNAMPNTQQVFKPMLCP